MTIPDFEEIQDQADALSRMNSARAFETRVSGSPVPENAEEVFEHAGVLCAIARNSLIGYNGYVQLPPDVRRLYPNYDDLNVRVHGGLTWGMDGGGWVGFDTLHSGDVWPMSELHPDRKEEYPGYDPCEIARGRSLERQNRWTYDKVRVETMMLADQIGRTREYVWTEWSWGRKLGIDGVRTRFLPPAE